jgi:2-C-methyl-D-erythritol 2,4-cyclodiphosphate synthase
MTIGFRIGQGVDVHAFGLGDHLVLGGVTIPYSQGLIAHSDGDVLLHAVCDALLGAAGLGDIGKHFPDNEVEYKNIDSRLLLRRVFRSVNQLGYQVINIDNTLIAQAPKMAPYIAAINANIASDLNCDISQINTKATTTEKLGFNGRKEGITALSIALIYKPSSSGEEGL